MEKPGDLAGTKMRMPPGASFQVLAKALGATPVAMPITEVYLGLKTGQIDAQDNPTNMTRDWKFHEVTKQVVLTKHLVQPVFIAMAKPAFDKLTPAQQAELRSVAREASDMQIAKTLQDEKSALDTFRAANVRISEPDASLFRTTVFKEYETSGMTAKGKPGVLARLQAVQWAHSQYCSEPFATHGYRSHSAEIPGLQPLCGMADGIHVHRHFCAVRDFCFSALCIGSAGQLGGRIHFDFVFVVNLFDRSAGARRARASHF